ncbi:MAG: hypothetical protein QM725_16910 [Lacibacter sp.]
MKQLLFTVFCFAMLASASAQSERYTGAMQKNFEAMASANTPAGMLDVSNAFERIANAEKNQWLPFYYSSLCKVWYAFMLNDPKQYDQIADQCDSLIAKAELMEKNNSEIVLLKSMVATLRMIVDPMSRYMQYGMMSNQYIEESKQLDPANPRPYMWQAQGVSKTPVQFDGGCDKAKPIFEKALELFKAFKPKSPLHPDWGKDQTEKAYSECK